MTDHETTIYQPTSFSHSWRCECGKTGVPVHSPNFNALLAEDHVNDPDLSVTAQYLQRQASKLWTSQLI